MVVVVVMMVMVMRVKVCLCMYVCVCMCVRTLSPLSGVVVLLCVRVCVYVSIMHLLYLYSLTHSILTHLSLTHSIYLVSCDSLIHFTKNTQSPHHTHTHHTLPPTSIHTYSPTDSLSIPTLTLPHPSYDPPTYSRSLLSLILQ